ncbi:MAG: class I tRNA ligase family protein, partial [Phycisphaerae bacterium]
NIREYDHEVGHSYRSHVPIEPYLSDQWYIAVKKPIAECGVAISEWVAAHADLVDKQDDVTYLKGTDVPVNSLAGLALAPLMDGRLRFVPDRYAKNYQTWLENLRDWPISRQLWWGHQIPIWSKTGDDKPIPEDAGKVLYRTAENDEGETITYACVAGENKELETELEDAGFRRDPDVLDTWFSSALWPFSTLGWPDETDELKTFYPGNVLCTAREIITLWVSRMVMMGQYCLGDIPFHDVFIHAMIQDGEGRKMSKSLGNGVDPLVVIESHGADAMRFTLASMTTQTQDVRMPIESITLPDGREVNSSPKFDLGRNFCNKLWNASRFVLMKLEAIPAWDDIDPTANLADRWILSRLNKTVRDVTKALENYRYNELADRLYHFMWDDFCDWYVEIVKSRINEGEQAPKAVIAHVMDQLLRTLHPVAPFITEAIWEKLNEVAPTRGPQNATAEQYLVGAAWPAVDASVFDDAAEADFELICELVRNIRNARSQHNVPPSEKVDVVVEATGETAEKISANAALLAGQANLNNVTVTDKAQDVGADAAAIALSGMKAYVLGIIDKQAELERLTKQKEQLVKGIGGAEGKLSNENFVNKAPEQVVQRERDRLAEMQTELAAVEESLKALG